MKIAGKVIQEKNITMNSDNEFIAKYSGKEILISSNHGFGSAKYEHLTRFDITVYDLKSGMKDVDTYKDCHSIRDAIIYALKGSCLI